MTDAERDEYVKQFDKPIPLSKTRALTKQERQQFERSQRSPHRSIFIMKDADGIFVRIEPDVLRRSSRYAAEHKMTLSEVINRSLKGLLAIVE